MPNWCFNYLTVTGPAEEVVRFQQHAAGDGPGGLRESGQVPNSVLDFHSLVPMPPEILAADGTEARRAWQYKHWSCHFAAHHAVVADQWHGGLAYHFSTDWTPAVRFVLEVSQAWPALRFELEYEEHLAGYCGLARAQAGKLEDKCTAL